MTVNVAYTDDLSTLGSAIDAFKQSRTNLRPATIKKYKEVLTLFESFLTPEYPVARIETRQIEQFLNGTGRKAITKKTYSTTLSPLFNWLVKEGALAHNPVKEIRLEQVPSKFPKFLSPGEVEFLCSLIQEVEGERGRWLINVISANVYLGLRLGELSNLRWEDVDLSRRRLTVRNSDDFTTKSGKERTLPLCRPVYEILVQLSPREGPVFRSIRGTQVNKQYVSERFRRYTRLAGLKGINFHSTRHTAASWLAQTGCSIEAIRRYMGHSTITVTQKYMHLSSDTLADQIERAFGSL